MKNHFAIAYSGNKRDEVDKIYESLSDLENIDTIVEPFCGSSAISYYISTLHPKKFKYVLNDNNKYLIELYKVLKNPELRTKLIIDSNKIMESIDKTKYDLLKKDDTFISWFIMNSFFNIRPGLFPIDKPKRDYKYLDNCPIVNFLETENIILTNDNGIKTYDTYKNNKKCLIFLDPPYINTNNSFYYDAELNIYEHLYKNPINKCKAVICLILEDIWIIKLLFKNYEMISYPKLYQTSKKKTNHIIIFNKKI